MAKDEIAEREWKITPGLNHAVDDFIRLYEHLRGKSGLKVPIMILGDRGVGKSLFVHIYRTIYEKDNPGKKVVRLNVAALTETLIESELFGYVKGAFTGAGKSGEKGLVEEADLLILEEIGELKFHIQAKLLTFIEDGEYYKVGATNHSKAKPNLQIIATTNKNREDMRLDFYDRFVKFSVPPLYQRRGDVLYYINQFFPGLLKNFRPWEILTLLAYPWPGNVREILNCCLDMELFSLQHENDHRLQKKPPISFVKVKKDHTALTWGNCYKLFRKLNKAGINSELLEKTLNEYCVGINPFNDKNKPLSYDNSKGTIEEPIRDKSLGTSTLPINNKFAKAYEGLTLYCSLFYKSLDDPTDLLEGNPDVKKVLPDNPIRNILKPTSKHDHLVKDILEWIFNVKISAPLKEQTLTGMDDIKYWGWFHNAFGLALKESDADGPISEAKEPKENPFDMKEDDLLKAYYEHLLHKTAGNKTEAAKLAGKNKDTFYSKLKKADIT
jgi:transcriptional regulator with PAS, ATPase and Fis domain